MSGTFGELSVPPTLVSFAVGTLDARHVISPEFKAAGSTVVQLRARPEPVSCPIPIV
jgi:phosphoribosylformylglycinamidine synthase